MNVVTETCGQMEDSNEVGSRKGDTTKEVTLDLILLGLNLDKSLKGAHSYWSVIPACIYVV